MSRDQNINTNRHLEEIGFKPSQVTSRVQDFRESNYRCCSLARELELEVPEDGTELLKNLVINLLNEGWLLMAGARNSVSWDGNYLVKTLCRLLKWQKGFRTLHKLRGQSSGRVWQNWLNFEIPLKKCYKNHCKLQKNCLWKDELDCLIFQNFTSHPKLQQVLSATWPGVTTCLSAQWPSCKGVDQPEEEVPRSPMPPARGRWVAPHAQRHCLHSIVSAVIST